MAIGKDYNRQHRKIKKHTATIDSTESDTNNTCSNNICY